MLAQQAWLNSRAQNNKQKLRKHNKRPFRAQGLSEPGYPD